jgi:hypothetical protein
LLQIFGATYAEAFANGRDNSDPPNRA